MKGILSGLRWAGIWAVLLVVTLGAAVVPFALLLFLIFGGAVKRQAKAFESLKTTLMKDESLIAHAIQHRVFALWSRRWVVGITPSRIIFIKRGLIGGFEMSDIQWKDLRDVTIEQNAIPTYCGSNLTFKAVSDGADASMVILGIPEAVAPRIYATAQAEEQAWEEKRRVRAMEEKRAAAGGVTVQAPAAGEYRAAGAKSRVLEEIESAKRLLDTGAISDAEYQEMKSKILSSSTSH